MGFISTLTSTMQGQYRTWDFQVKSTGGLTFLRLEGVKILRRPVSPKNGKTRTAFFSVACSLSA